MSLQRIVHNDDISRLLSAGLSLKEVGGYLIVENVPYMDGTGRSRADGILCTVLELSGNNTIRPTKHEMQFGGAMPFADDKELGVANNTVISKDLKTDVQLSFHPGTNTSPENYRDYYHKVTTYLAKLGTNVEDLTPYGFLPVTDDSDETPFHYMDTAAARTGTWLLNQKLKELRIGIVGLGGTGSYVLDFVAKSHVRQITLFDDDEYLTHNAFRAPGAPTKQNLEVKPLKVDYHNEVYSQFRDGIVSHAIKINETNIEELNGLDFVFICIDNTGEKQIIFKSLEEWGIPFIDVGMGLINSDSGITGNIRVSTSDDLDRSILKANASVLETADDDLYSTNIQVVELNALNAALAVIRWKKYYGFYFDGRTEHNSYFQLSMNVIANDE